MSKLFGFLKKMSAIELKQFEMFVDSELYNKRKDVQHLLKYWIRHPKNTKKEIFFAYVFPEKEFNSKEWNFLTSRLFKLGEQFLAIKGLMENPLQQKIFLGKSYRKKQMINYYKSNFLEKKKLLQKQDLRNEEWLQQNFAIESDYYDYIASQNRKLRTNLQTTSDALDGYFVANKLKTACLAISRQNINQEKYEIRLLENILIAIEQDEILLQEPAAKVYYYCYKAITKTENEFWFTQLRKAMEVHQQCFPPSEQRDIFMLATNYCIRQLNLGKQNFNRETFELYRLSLDAGYLLEDGVMPESTFGNIVTLCTRLDEFNWAKEFILEHRKFLKPTFQEPMYSFSFGKLFFAEGNYDESLRYLAQVDTKAKFLLIGTKVLQLKIYFEKKELDVLDSLLESFRVFLQRQKDLGYHKKNYEYLISYVKKLLEMPYKSSKEQKAFRNEVENNKEFTEKEWVLLQLGK